MCRRELFQEIGREGVVGMGEGLLGKGSSRCQGSMGNGQSVFHRVGAECEGSGTRSERASEVRPRELLKVFK